MKKVIFSLGLLACISTVAQAQSAKFGIKAGVSLTNITGKNTDDTKNLFGFHGGLLANFAINDAFSIQPELLYSMKGTKAEDSGSFGGVSYSDKITSRLHYIDIPVLARVNAGGLFFELGPQLGFLVAANQKEEATMGSATQTRDTDIKDQLKSVDFGYAAGLGYQLSNGPGIGLRYNGGFLDLNKNNSTDPAVHNSAFQLYLSYMFGGK